MPSRPLLITDRKEISRKPELQNGIGRGRFPTRDVAIREGGEEIHS